MYPKIVKHLIFPLHEKFMGRRTMSCLDELEKWQWAEPEEIQELQLAKLKSLLMHATDNIPFYNERFRKFGFNPQEIKSIKDIRDIPMLTKEEIRTNLEAMLWKECPGGLHRYNTGGSSGQPLVFYFDRRRQAFDKAARIMTHRWWGVDIGDREFYLWGSPLEMAGQDRLKQIRDRLTNEYLYSAFEISQDMVPEIVTRLEKFRPKCLFGYPSTISLFCSMAGKQHIDLSGLGITVVFSTAEVLYEHQKRIINQALGGIPVVDSYGSREGGFINHQCREGTYHVMDPNYILELINDDGKPVLEGETGEVVITHLDAWGMPFIRYRTGDMAKSDGMECPCGRGLSSMASLQGRTTDFIVTPDGRWQHALSLIYVVRDIEGVSEFKIVQEEIDLVRVLIRTDSSLYPDNGDRRIRQGFKKRMGGEVKVRIEHVEMIPRDASGKFRYVVSNVGGNYDC
ncbi:phenylacetate--CoA ligase family protein [Desulfonatronovibrio hydrogenovorans]|uniref:phenylacetate--CoA ligase family protein n=1 Tax=Desulfonatronovibrio hydrogenovorans TaxID=53245 RepID=UPI000553F74F|nr:phenylacetate--CoA ligase family protein [Desulfonatronovibrio hydrogenovorans]